MGVASQRGGRAGADMCLVVAICRLFSPRSPHNPKSISGFHCARTKPTNPSSAFQPSGKNHSGTHQPAFRMLGVYFPLCLATWLSVVSSTVGSRRWHLNNSGCVAVAFICVHAREDEADTYIWTHVNQKRRRRKNPRTQAAGAENFMVRAVDPQNTC